MLEKEKEEKKAELEKICSEKEKYEGGAPYRTK